MTLPPVARPTLAVHESRARANIRAMAAKARRSGVRFRPHFKTHQSLRVGRWFREEGVSAITVSSPDMALEFAADGWEDILIAVPLNPGALPLYCQLTQTVRLGLVADHPQHAAFLLDSGLDAQVWIKVDAGYGRAGRMWSDAAGLRELAASLSRLPRARLAGVLAHSGQTYAAESGGAIRDIWKQAAERMSAARASCGIPGLEISVGDTPGCSLMEHFSGCDEVRPGNFVYYDLQQFRIGSCGIADLAAAVHCPVLSLHPGRNEVIVHGGAVHFSRDTACDPGLGLLHGRVFSPAGTGWDRFEDGVAMVRLSQEHGVLSAPPGWTRDRRIGETLRIAPAHACLAVAALRPHIDFF